MDRLVALAVSRRYLMVGMFVAVLVGGLIAFKQLNIEAYPTRPRDGRYRDAEPGLSSEEIETLHHDPDRDPGRRHQESAYHRTISLYGLSDVKLQFSFDYTYDEALQQVLNRLSQSRRCRQRPAGHFTAQRDRRIYRYRLKGPPNSACSTSRRCRTGCCSAASAPCPA